MEEIKSFLALNWTSVPQTRLSVKSTNDSAVHLRDHMVGFASRPASLSSLCVGSESCQPLTRGQPYHPSGSRTRRREAATDFLARAVAGITSSRAGPDPIRTRRHGRRRCHVKQLYQQWEWEGWRTCWEGRTCINNDLQNFIWKDWLDFLTVQFFPSAIEDVWISKFWHVWTRHLLCKKLSSLWTSDWRGFNPFSFSINSNKTAQRSSLTHPLIINQCPFHAVNLGLDFKDVTIQRKYLFYNLFRLQGITLQPGCQYRSFILTL